MDIHLQMGIYEHACVHMRALDQLVECVCVCDTHVRAHTLSGGQDVRPLIFCLLEIPFELLFTPLS